jgi:class 3 adenylate cyclase
MAIRDGLHAELDIDIRAGVHIAECETVAGKVGSVGVAVAARVMSHGGAGDVLIPLAVRDCLLGTEFVFEAREAVALKGVPGDWMLYSVQPES